ncbi:MAG TPA: hypothetical protein VLP43_02765 [Solirubrobacteraceae bacterium]|nr:hypothetical protein [Solirubrobacteraceae bacterium]
MLELLSVGAVAWMAIVMLVIGMCRASSSADKAAPLDPVADRL